VYQNQVVALFTVVSYAKSGISEKMMNKMKRGHLDNVSELDLHGYTVKQTCEALSEFIYREQFEMTILCKGWFSFKLVHTTNTVLIDGCLSIHSISE
jgi:hypothetical protein